MNEDACIFWPYLHLMNPPGDRYTPILVSDWPPAIKIYYPNSFLQGSYACNHHVLDAVILEV